MEVLPASPDSEFLTSVVGIHEAGCTDWFFTFVHAKNIVTKAELRAALLVALRPKTTPPA